MPVEEDNLARQAVNSVRTDDDSEAVPCWKRRFNTRDTEVFCRCGLGAMITGGLI